MDVLRLTISSGVLLMQRRVAQLNVRVTVDARVGYIASDRGVLPVAPTSERVQNVRCVECRIHSQTDTLIKLSRRTAVLALYVLENRFSKLHISDPPLRRPIRELEVLDFRRWFSVLDARIPRKVENSFIQCRHLSSVDARSIGKVFGARAQPDLERRGSSTPSTSLRYT